ncbi:DedA family protein [Pleomorphomonas sp. PLEO]|uniref:DedA family protein n=1 Tax=Pleomorphomonas sp. PLEO TaxID=3239306 RepID=UPI00351EAE98
MDATHLVAMVLSFGLPGLLFIALAEKFTPIIPSYVLLMLIGMTISNSAMLVLAILATATGSLTGSVIWYGVGRLFGAVRVEAIVARFGKYVFFSGQHYQHLANAYRRNHFWVTLFGQTIPVARIYLALPAGVFAIQPVVFVVAAGFGIVLWNAPFLTLGYLLRGGGHDPVHVGFWVSAALVATEMTILVGYRLRGMIIRRWERCPAGASS